jgi:hypothetical protein
VHHITTDPGRSSKGWYRTILAGGLAPEHYVETVSVDRDRVAYEEEAGNYPEGRLAARIMTAMSLAPEEVRGFLARGGRRP